MQFFWKKDGWFLDDPHLVRLQSMPFQRPFMEAPTANGAYLIRGPRQVGKTSLLKAMLKQATDEGRTSFYFSCENLADYKDLAQVLESARGCDLVLIDEISFVREWWRAVKHTLDSAHIRVLVITGSNTVDLRMGMDQMPGRWGHGGESQLLPMDFNEFQRMRAQANWPKVSFLDELLMYFRVGGFPTALAESGPTSEITPIKSMTTYKQWLLGDVLKLGRQEVYLKELLFQIARTTTSTVSLQTLAKNTQMGSHHTALEYVQILEDCFALKTLYAYDPEKKSFHFRKEKKFYLRDPILFWLIHDWVGASPSDRCLEQIAEMVAHEHILRRSKRFGYYTTKKGEIDFIGENGWALEVKWQPIVESLSKVYKEFKSSEKIIWYQGNFLKEWPSQI